MNRFWLNQPQTTIALALLLGLGAAETRADEPVQVETKVLETEFDQLPDTQLFLGNRALAKGIQKLREEQKEELAQLTARFLAERDPARAEALQQQILVHKLESECELLEMQLAHAREIGASKQLSEGEAVLAQLRKVLEAKKETLLSMEGSR